MKVQVNTDHNIHGNEATIREVEATVEAMLVHFSEHITRVEVHVNDENAGKGGGSDLRCVMEARLEKHQPMSVTEDAGSFDEAVKGAAHKLKRLLHHTLDRSGEHGTE